MGPNSITRLHTIVSLDHIVWTSRRFRVRICPRYENSRRNRRVGTVSSDVEWYFSMILAILDSMSHSVEDIKHHLCFMKRNIEIDQNNSHVLLIVLGKPIQLLLEIFSDPAPLTRNFVWIGQISTNLMDKCEDPLQPSRFVGFRIVLVTAEVDTGHPLLFEG